jgi:protein-S-isoprenylcysteine O-methyltransferase Ste14
MLLNHVILALLWIVYCALHSLMASVGIKNWLEKISGSSYRYYRLFYSLFSFFFLVVVLYFQFMLPTIILYKVPALVFAFGSVLGLSGLLLMLFCIKKYFMNLSGVRSLVYETTYNDLLITGIHRYVRHPLYLGTFAFIWGLFLAGPYLSLLIANSIITIYTLIGIKLEEDKLIGEFGESYKNYQQSVPKLLPFGRVKQKV